MILFQSFAGFWTTKTRRAAGLLEIIPSGNMMVDLILIREIHEKAGYLFPLE